MDFGDAMERSRRVMMFKSAAAVAGLASLPLLSHAQGKATKKAMQYQDQPKNGQECDTCLQYVPGANPKAKGTCKVVEGDISPKGWCAAYVKKT
jgi:hypothetical protein